MNDRATLLHIVLVEPCIPTNTGSIIRLCANTGCRLHLVEPLGFRLDEASVRRGGLDYHELTVVTVHPSWEDARRNITAVTPNGQWFATTASATVRHTDVDYQAGDVVVFGTEPTGLPPEILDEFAAPSRLAIPMRPDNRSLNLSNAAAVVAYEAWRQHDFAGGAVRGTIAER